MSATAALPSAASIDAIVAVRERPSGLGSGGTGPAAGEAAKQGGLVAR